MFTSRLLCYRLSSIPLLCSVLFASSALGQGNLPQPDPEFKGKIGETFKDSKADPAMFASPTAPEGAPNILLVLIDDAGFERSRVSRAARDPQPPHFMTLVATATRP